MVTASTDGTARVWDTRDGTELLTLTGHDGPLGRPVAFSPDGLWIATTGTDKTMRFWYSHTGEMVTTIDTAKAPVFDFVWHPDSGHLFVLMKLQTWDFRLCRLDIATGKVTQTLAQGLLMAQG